MILPIYKRVIDPPVKVNIVFQILVGIIPSCYLVLSKVLCLRTKLVFNPVGQILDPRFLSFVIWKPRSIRSAVQSFGAGFYWSVPQEFQSLIQLPHSNDRYLVRAYGDVLPEFITRSGVSRNCFPFQLYIWDYCILVYCMMDSCKLGNLHSSQHEKKEKRFNGHGNGAHAVNM